MLLKLLVMVILLQYITTNDDILLEYGSKPGQLYVVHPVQKQVEVDFVDTSRLDVKYDAPVSKSIKNDKLQPKPEEITDSVLKKAVIFKSSKTGERENSYEVYFKNNAEPKDSNILKGIYSPSNAKMKFTEPQKEYRVYMKGDENENVFLYVNQERHWVFGPNPNTVTTYRDHKLVNPDGPSNAGWGYGDKNNLLFINDTDMRVTEISACWPGREPAYSECMCGDDPKKKCEKGRTCEGGINCKRECPKDTLIIKDCSCEDEDCLAGNICKDGECVNDCPSDVILKKQCECGEDYDLCTMGKICTEGKCIEGCPWNFLSTVPCVCDQGTTEPDIQCEVGTYCFEGKCSDPQTKPPAGGFIRDENGTIPEEVIEAAMQEGDVICGGHTAKSCGECGDTSDRCHGDCLFSDIPTQVVCGGHSANSCSKCGEGESACNGECEWYDGECTGGEDLVSCGGHDAHTCSECGGMHQCNDDCQWINDQCVGICRDGALMQQPMFLNICILYLFLYVFVL